MICVLNIFVFALFYKCKKLCMLIFFFCKNWRELYLYLISSSCLEPIHCHNMNKLFYSQSIWLFPMLYRNNVAIPLRDVFLQNPQKVYKLLQKYSSHYYSKCQSVSIIYSDPRPFGCSELWEISVSQIPAKYLTVTVVSSPLVLAFPGYSLAPENYGNIISFAKLS